MTFWWSTVSALLAGVATGIILRILYQRKKNGISQTKIKHSALEDADIESNVEVKGVQLSDVSNIDINDAKLTRSKIKSNVNING